jgi:hypothetical protein
MLNGQDRISNQTVKPKLNFGAKGWPLGGYQGKGADPKAGRSTKGKKEGGTRDNKSRKCLIGKKETWLLWNTWVDGEGPETPIAEEVSFANQNVAFTKFDSR